MELSSARPYQFATRSLDEIFADPLSQPKTLRSDEGSAPFSFASNVPGSQGNRGFRILSKIRNEVDEVEGQAPQVGQRHC